VPDEPQHVLMGQITQELIGLMRIAQAPFPATEDALGPALDAAVAHMAAEGLPYAFVMSKGDVQDSVLRQRPPAPRGRGHLFGLGQEGSVPPTRAGVLQRFLELTDDETAVIATTGKCGRELFTLADRKQHLYQVGSMGGATGMALGVALNTSRRTVVLDGDGAALMKLGTLATVGAYQPRNLIHILLDNGVHDSTGGQATVSPTIDFSWIAHACGYEVASTCASLAGFEHAWWKAQDNPGPHFIHVRIAPGSMEKLGRPTVGPAAVAQRFKAFLAEPIP
jgi:phosphonopyruvate decarboxylase